MKNHVGARQETVDYLGAEGVLKQYRDQEGPDARLNVADLTDDNYNDGAEECGGDEAEDVGGSKLPATKIGGRVKHSSAFSGVC